MGKIENGKKTLWMRYVDFDRIKDMLHLVSENNGKLKAGELENRAIQEGILVKENGKPFSHSPRYHYRKVMENLGLLDLCRGLYYVAQNEKAGKLLEATELKKSMSPQAKEIIRRVITENQDCKKYFFDIFMENTPYDLYGLRKGSRWIVVQTKGKKGIILINPFTRKKNILKKADEIHAIFWGVRLWALELEITDEIFISYKEGRFIYPINPYVSSTVVVDSIVEKISQAKEETEWVTLHLPTFVKENVLSNRLPIQRVKETLWKMKTNYSSLVIFIPSSTSFIDMRTPFSKQDSVLFRPYLVTRNGEYISHIKVNKEIINIIKRR